MTVNATGSSAPIVGHEDLILETPEEPSVAVIVGYNWTLVEAAGGIGLVATPANGRDGARTTNDTGHFTGRDLRNLAALTRSANPYERAIGCAAINAGVNRSNIKGASRNGLEGPADVTGRVVVVGRFPALSEKISEAIVLERNPGPGDLHADMASEVIPGCRALIITASAWLNGSLAELLRLGQGAQITLVGPGTPLSPRLHDHGIHRLAGFVVTEREALRRVVAEGGAVRHFRHLGRIVLLER